MIAPSVRAVCAARFALKSKRAKVARRRLAALARPKHREKPAQNHVRRQVTLVRVLLHILQRNVGDLPARSRCRRANLHARPNIDYRCGVTETIHAVNSADRTATLEQRIARPEFRPRVRRGEQQSNGYSRQDSHGAPMKKSAPPPCDGGANARKGGGRQSLAPPWQPEIGPQHGALDSGHSFNVRHALDRDAAPLRDRAGRDAEAARQFSPRACGLNRGGEPCVKFFCFHAWQISHTKNACQVQKMLDSFF